MSATVTPPPKPATVTYPDSDGKPMADNTIQFRWILMLYTYLAGLYRTDEAVFVAGDHLIYPTEGANKVRHAPDVYVAYGRPKGDRGSYRVWEEGDIFPQVIFEVWSPNNRYDEMRDKFAFYETHGAEEYYILYPEFPMYAEVYRRDGGRLARVEPVNGYVSPRTGLRFALETGQLTVFGGDGRPLRTVEEQAAEREAAERFAREQQERAEAEAVRAETERKKAAAEAERAESERKKAAAEAERAARLAAKLRELGVNPDTV
jgi:Uma2 family endonuclease